MTSEDVELIATRDCRIVPAWARSELIATEPARGRLRQWVAAGKPQLSSHDIGARLRFFGAGSTVDVIRQVLASGAIAVPAVWHLVERVSTIAIGRDCRGLAVPTPSPTAERLIVFRDDVDDAEMVSCFLHELAHCWLLPIPARDLAPAEEALVAGPDVWRTAYRLGFFDEIQQRVALDEQQACSLAKAWGATGRSADASLCARGIEALSEREAVR